MEVYRNRLSGKDQPLMILTDLYGPAPPPAAAVLTAPMTMRGRTN
jgi:hypothetical protein